MTESEKRHILLTVSVGAAILVLLAVAVTMLDMRSVAKIVLARLPIGLEHPVYDDDAISPEDFTLPRNVAMRGPIERGQTVIDLIGMARMEGWTLEGHAGDVFVLDFDPLSSDYVWQMDVYGPDHRLLAFIADSDAGYADFTRLEIELPGDGIYTIVVRALGMDGKYRLQIR